jgi:hypothetical protein
VSSQIISYAKKASEYFNYFTSTAGVISSHLNSSMELVLRDQLSKSGNLLQVQTEKVLEDFKLAVRESHRDVAVPAIMQYLTPIYDMCGAEGGTLILPYLYIYLLIVIRLRPL